MPLRAETLYWELEARTETLAKGFGAAERRARQFAGIVLQHPVAALGSLAAAAVLVGVETAKMAAKLDNAFREINRLVPMTEQQLARLRDRVIELSTKTPQTAEQLAAGLKTIIELGERNPEQAFRTLELSAQAAAGTGAQLTSVIQLLDSTTDAYGESAGGAARQLDLLVQASRGGASLEAIGQVLEGTAAAAAAAGMPLTNLLASILALANAGVPTERITKMLRGELTGLGEDAEASSRMQRELGIGLEKVGGQFVVTGRAAEGYRQGLELLEGAQGAAQRAAEEHAKTLDQQYAILKNRVNAELLRLGTQVLPIVIAALKATGEAWDYWFNAPARQFSEYIAALRTRIVQMSRSLEQLTGEERAAKLEELRHALRNFRMEVTGGGSREQLAAWSNVELRQAWEAVERLRTGSDDARYALQALGREIRARGGRAVVWAPPPAEGGAGGTGTTPPSGEVLRERQRLLEALQSQIDRLTTSTFDEAVRALDRLEAQLRESGAATAQWSGQLARLRADLGIQGELEDLGAVITAYGEEIDQLVEKQQMGTAEWRRTEQALQDNWQRVSTWVQSLEAGTEKQRDGLALLRQIEALQRRMGEAGKKAEQHGKVLVQHDDERLRKLQAQARNIEAAVRGALQLASAFGLVDEESARALENIAQIAANLPAALTGDMGSILSIVGAMAQLMTGSGGENAAQVEGMRALNESAQAILALARMLGESQLRITGRQYAGISGATIAGRGAAAAYEAGGGTRVAGLSAAYMEAFNRQLAAMKLQMADVREAAAALGVVFVDELKPTFQELIQLGLALRDTELDRLANTVAGRMERFQRTLDAFDITDPLDQLMRLAAAIGGVGDSALAGIGAFDLSKPEDRAAADAFLRDLFTRATSGGLSREQIGALFGDLTPTEFLDALAALESAIDAANAGEGTGTPSVGVERAVTEVTANRLGSLLTTDVYWNQQTAQSAQRIEALLLEACLTSPGLQPPTYGELDRYRPGGEVVITVAEGAIQITIQGAVSTEDAQAAGVAAAEGFLGLLDAQLGIQQRRRGRGTGTTTLQ